MYTCLLFEYFKHKKKMNMLNEIIEKNKKVLSFGIVLVSLLSLKKLKNIVAITFKYTQRLDGKIAIITGSNCGIGYETALDLAYRGATIVLACRNLQAANLVRDKICSKTKNFNIFVEFLDLTSFESVKEFSIRILNRFDQINLLINNAGEQNKLFTFHY